MAIASNPSLLIADEPTTALDVTVEKQIIKLMRNILDKFGTSLLFISHDLEVIKQVCERVAVMYAGSIVEVGPCQQILNKPFHPYTKALIEAAPSRIKRGKKLRGIDGIVPELINLPEGCIYAPRCNKCFEECCKGQPPELVEIADNRYIACCNYER